MARKYKETTELVDMPNLNPNGGFPDKGAIAGRGKSVLSKDLEEFAQGGGTQSGSHPAKTQSRVMRYF